MMGARGGADRRNGERSEVRRYSPAGMRENTAGWQLMIDRREKGTGSKGSAA
jgi:hypothetical protein